MDGNVILAPMAGVTDLPFRLLCKEQGADVMVTEMVSAKGLYYGSRKTDLLLQTDDREKPVGVQLFGSDPDIMAGEAEKLAKRGFDFIDINMGCPVPKIVNNGEGSALMKNPELAERIVRSIVEAVDIPVTVKIRAGFTKDSINAPDMARAIESGGASAVAVHARTREQYYSGKSDWSVIKAVKAAVKIPVIGNGDITDGPSARKMLEETGVDGFMIGRAARGNPWIFKEIPYYLETGEVMPRPGMDELIDTITEHARMLTDVKGEYIAVREMRRHVGYYTAGLKNSAAMRRDVNYIEDLDSLIKFLDNIRTNKYTSSGR